MKISINTEIDKEIFGIPEVTLKIDLGRSDHVREILIDGKVAEIGNEKCYLKHGVERDHNLLVLTIFSSTKEVRILRQCMCLDKAETVMRAQKILRSLKSMFG